MVEREWTETYHSWEEYVAKHPNYDKHISSALAAGLAKMEIERDGVHIGHYFSIDWYSPRNAVTHGEVSAYLKKLQSIRKESRKSKLQLD